MSDYRHQDIEASESPDGTHDAIMGLVVAWTCVCLLSVVLVICLFRYAL